MIIKMYALRNKKTGNFLNHASKRKKLFSKGLTYRVISSPYPTLRTITHVHSYLNKWGDNTPFPEEWELIIFKGEVNST